MLEASCEKYISLKTDTQATYANHENLVHHHFSKGWAYVQNESFHQFITPDGRFKDLYTKDGKWFKREPLYKAA